MRTALIALACSLITGVAGYVLGWYNYAPTSSEKKLKLDIADNGVYRVRAVVDGDTVVLENGLHLRYNGLNAPESGRWVKDAAPYAKDATRKNIDLVEGKRIRVKLAGDPIDMHGRAVANVFLVPDDPSEPEIEIREVLLKQGFGKAMGVGVSGDEYKTLKSWQDEAKAAKLGMWGIVDAPKPDAEKSPNVAKAFCATSSGKTYHKAECHIARRILAANRHEYATAEEAEAVGLRACASCLGKK